MMSKENIEELKKILPNKIFDSVEELKKHSGNIFHIGGNLSPDVICYPESDTDVMSVTNFCFKKKIPIISYGSGTSVEGQTAAVQGGVCVNMSKMKSILEVNEKDGYATVQAGIPYNELNSTLEPLGFHFPVEAGWGASIGGMAATNASGAGATDSGSMSKNVISCTVIVYKNGVATKIESGTKALKSSAGYNLTSLFVGSEGTLGIITAVTLKLRRNFTNHETICCQFEEIEQAINYVIFMKGRVQFRKVELLDKLQTNACLKYSGIKYINEDKYTVIMEFSGNEHTVQEEARMAVYNLKSYMAQNIKIFNGKRASEEIWMMRKNACPAAIKFIDQNKKAMATDVCVPLSKLLICIESCYKKMNELGINAPLVAHVGDGNFHFTILIDPNNIKEKETAELFNSYIVNESLKLGGTCSGEHGIGIGKSKYLAQEHAETIFMMRAIKQAFDPYGIFNPGKIFNFQESFLYKNKNVCELSIYSEAETFQKKMYAKM